jgi:hypothetical protein
MADTQALFETQRSRLLHDYADAGQDFAANTKPYKSTASILFVIVEPKPAAAPLMAHAVARRDQNVTFFDYGVGTPVTDVLSSNSWKATDADTNLANGTETNGNSDFVIEGISVSVKGHRIKWPLGTSTGAVGLVADKDVINAYESLAAPASSAGPPALIMDPAALMSPPQLQSPFNLEQALFSAVQPALSMAIAFDRRSFDRIGTLDEIPEGGAKSYLRSNGDPRTDNRYKIPEGLIWRRKGEPDSNFQVVLRLEQAVVVPINLVGLFGAVQNPLIVPQAIALDLTMRVHGLNVFIRSSNA